MWTIEGHSNGRRGVSAAGLKEPRASASPGYARAPRPNACAKRLVIAIRRALAGREPHTAPGGAPNRPCGCNCAAR